MKLQEIFLIESPVSELEKNLQKPHSYDAIDHLMTGISNKHGITPKELHDEFVKQHGKTPDEWISEITEAPLVDIEPLGDFDKPGGFRSKVDKRIVTNPVVHDRARKFFSRSPYDFRIYPINVPGGSKFLETGEVTMDWLEENLPVAYKKLEEVPVEDDEIVVFFTNNTGDERVPLTPWMMAHRMSHAFRAGMRRNSGHEFIFNELERILAEFAQETLVEVYGLRSIATPTRFMTNLDKIIHPHSATLFASIGTMRSARSIKKYSRPYEFIHELFAQNTNSGKIKFNPLPQSIKVGRPVFGRWEEASVKDQEAYQEQMESLETLSRTLEYYLNELLSSAQGSIYIM